MNCSVGGKFHWPHASSEAGAFRFADETPDVIVGILNTRALLLESRVVLADAIEFPSFVPESMNLLHLLKSLQRQQRGLGRGSR